MNGGPGNELEDPESWTVSPPWKFYFNPWIKEAVALACVSKNALIVKMEFKKNKGNYVDWKQGGTYYSLQCLVACWIIVGFLSVIEQFTWLCLLKACKKSADSSSASRPSLQQWWTWLLQIWSVCACRCILLLPLEWTSEFDMQQTAHLPAWLLIPSQWNMNRGYGCKVLFIVSSWAWSVSTCSDCLQRPPSVKSWRYSCTYRASLSIC